MAEPQAPAPEGAGGGVSELVVSVDSGLSKLAALAANAPSMPEGVAEALAQVREQYQAIISQLTGGGEGAVPERGVTTPEQGGAPGAVPVDQRARA